jgi:hypothetical protein
LTAYSKKGDASALEGLSDEMKAYSKARHQEFENLKFTVRKGGAGFVKDLFGIGFLLAGEVKKGLDMIDLMAIALLPEEVMDGNLEDAIDLAEEEESDDTGVLKKSIYQIELELL